MYDTGKYIGRHDAELAQSTPTSRLHSLADGGTGRYYEPRRLAAPEVNSVPRIADVSGARHNPRHAA